MGNDQSYEQELNESKAEIEQLQASQRIVTTAEGLMELEREIRRLTDRLGNALLGQKLAASLASEEMGQAESELVKRHPQRLKSEGKKEVTIRTSFGGTVRVRSSYYRRHCDRRCGKRHAGLYAGLVQVGIYERCTPGLTSEIGVLAVTLGSLAETCQVLAERGCELDVKTVRLIAYRTAERARLMQKAGQMHFGPADSVQGRRVVVSCDGGRVRLREKKRGPKTAKGRTRYRGAWREPKLFIIYVVDAEGKQSPSFAPLIDGLIQGPAPLFALLEAYLRQLQIQQADHLLFVADGAPWIWQRVPALLQTLGLTSQRTHLLLDFYHAVEHLHQVAALNKAWSAKTRQQWLNQQRKSLLAGQVDQLIAAIRLLCRGRRSSALRTQLNYFVNHRSHLDYARIAALNLPIGSGAMESAIRRIVNLRLKGPALFWCKHTADAFLMLRAFYKTGRWHQLTACALSPHIPLFASP